MKAIVSALVAAAILAALASPADAARQKKKKYAKKHHYHAQRYEGPRYASRKRGRGHYERQPEYDSNRLSFGSLQWWDQMVREGRAAR